MLHHCDYWDNIDDDGDDNNNNECGRGSTLV